MHVSGSPTERYGLAKSLSVMPGDVVDIEVYAKYVDPDEQNWTPLLTNLIAAMSMGCRGSDGYGVFGPFTIQLRREYSNQVNRSRWDEDRS